MRLLLDKNCLQTALHLGKIPMLDSRKWHNKVRNALRLLPTYTGRKRLTTLLDCGPEALKLADRDAWIGWTDGQRAERLVLEVQKLTLLGAGVPRSIGPTIYLVNALACNGSRLGLPLVATV